MAERFKIAIVGSGPGGKSAAAHAAELNVPHVLLEASPYLSYTIYRYQKGKHVMDEPGILPLRSPLPFKAGSREAILDAWNEGVQKLNTNVKFGHEVEKIQKGASGFTLHLRQRRQRSRPSSWSWASACRATSASSACRARTCPSCSTSSTTRTSTRARPSS